MCGLNAIIIRANNGFSADQNAMFATQICLTQFRGEDSTGVVSVDNEGVWQTLKIVGSPSNLFRSADWLPWYNDVFQKGKLTFGHGRAATRGTITTKNAHPFIVKKPNKQDLIFVHNGTLDATQHLPGFKDYQVDSEWLAQMIADHGPEETFSKVKGPIACMWWDAEEHTFNAYRNIDRPLFVVQNPQNKDLLINSEMEALMYIKHKFRLPFEAKDIQPFQVETHYKLDPEELDKGWTRKSIKMWYPPFKQTTYASPVVETPQTWWERQAAMSQPNPIKREWDRQPRNFEFDCQAIVAGKLLHVEFRPRTTCLDMSDRYTVTPQGAFNTEWCSPYKLDLIRMELSAADSKRVNCTFKDKAGTRWTVETPEITDPVILIPLGVKALDQVLPRACTGDVPLIKGTKKTWKTPKLTSRGDKIKHRATISDTHERHLQEYFNPIDGVFVVGDTILMEPDTYIQRGPDYLEIRGGRLTTEEHSKFVEFYCFVKGRSKEEMERLPFLCGTIKMIKLCTEAEYDAGGHCAYILLDNLSDGAENNDEESIVVMDNPALPVTH